MKKIYFLFMLLFIKTSYAVDWGFLGQWSKLRSGNVWLDDIPKMISHAIDYFMWIAGTISVIFIIIWAYQILFWSLSQDKTKWRNTIISAILGFILAALAWFIVRFIIDNFS
jgi:hypothetical protein